ncbi:MAG TPA: response regulator [Myxococcaceae bacterium]|nr:response regulator [Myxococcaceae bacterium]
MSTSPSSEQVGRTQPPFRLLFVDDEPLVLSAVRRVLKGLPVETSYAESAEAALRAMDGNVPDLLITDLHMGGMDGLALLEVVRAKHPHVQRVLHSANYRAPPGVTPPFRLLVKPCTPDTLRNVVADYVQLKSLGEPAK